MYISSYDKSTQTEFEFLFKNYTSNIYTSFVEKVDVITIRPTKLVLHFSDYSTIFYDFYNN